MYITPQSFGGVDMGVYIGGQKISNVSGISYSITREKAPQYVCGNPNPFSFGYGRRGISGAMTFALKNVTGLNEVLGTHAPNMVMKPGEDVFDPSVREANATSSDLFTIGKPWYPDQLPLMNIVMIFTNELFSAASVVIHGVTILSVAMGVSVEELGLEQQMTFMAQGVQQLKPIVGLGDATGTYQSAINTAIGT